MRDLTLRDLTATAVIAAVIVLAVWRADHDATVALLALAAPTGLLSSALERRSRSSSSKKRLGSGS